MIINLVNARFPRNFLFIVVWLVLSVDSHAQLGGAGTNPFTVNVLPPSPHASALAKYADIPVSLYSGTPQIAIPLYTLQERKLKLPIVLSYHAAGHKVEAVASRTGLGWSVLAEGVVTRAVRGWPDEHSQRGFLSQATRHQISDFAIGYRSREDQYDWYDAMAEGCMDIEPDLFYVNVAGYSFKFMFNWQGIPVIASEHKFKVTPMGIHAGTNDFIDGWEITAPDGTVFIFNVVETTDVQSSADHTIGCHLSLEEADIPQSWYLSEMRTPDQQTWIRFEYTGYSQHIHSWSMESKMHNQALSQVTPSREPIETVVYGKQLSRIYTSSGQTVIDFIPGAARTDIEGSESTLGEVTVKNIDGKIVKDWTFEYDYSTGRLTLKKVTEKAGTVAMPPYVLKYNSGTLPGTMSWAKDHWGFYNDNNFQTAIPATRVAHWGSTQEIALTGANREPSPSKVLIGMLREIQYPTGGKDVLEFEPHDYSFLQNQELISETTIPRHRTASAPEWDTPSGEVHVEQFQFTVPSPTLLNYSAWFTFGATFGGGTLAAVSFRIERTSDHEAIFHLGPGASRQENSNEDQYFGVLNLDPGTYTMIVSGRMGNDAIGRNFVTASIGWEEGTGQITTLIKQGGGVRIARITRSYGNGNPDKISRYVYRIQEDGRDKSSGSLLETAYHYEKWLRYWAGGGGGTLPGGGNLENKFYRFSQNRSALGSTQGSHVGYAHVTVLNGENGELGKTTYRYNSPREVIDHAMYNVPYPPAQSYDYKRGLLLEQTEFTAGNAGVWKVVNQYDFHDEQVLALKVGWAVPGDALTPRGPEFLDRYALGNYTNVFGYSRLKESRKINYSTSLSFPTSTVEKYTYNENTHKQLIRVIKNTSEPDSAVVQYTYPDDFAAGDAVLDAMKTRHMRSQVIETVASTKSDASQLGLVAASRKSYAIKGNCIVPDKEWSAPISFPVLTTNPLTTARNYYEDRLLYHVYDNYGNIMEHSMKNGIRTAYQWGHNATVPVAKADHAQAQQIYFTSFEEGAGTTTVQYRTGRKSKAVNGTFVVPITGATAGDYVLSYWAKEGNAPWSYREKSIVNYQPGQTIATNPVNGYIDEVRLFPKGATMTTYTYEPLVGVTSMTDSNNVTVYYNYDTFGRLSCLRDQDNNILECYEYKYQEEIPYAVHQD
jgi:YD repeat-containing protein